MGKIISADQILVLDHGRIVERGQHAELRRAGGLYGELAEMQFGMVESGTP
jgi:ABC-type multidrug transport system fused ATPase/permease subunit